MNEDEDTQEMPEEDDETVTDSDLFPLYKPEPPFMTIEGGFGYKGVILQSKKFGKIQCHLCGNLYKSVARHVSHKHGDIEEYRTYAGLGKFTPLVCEDTSQRLREFFNKLSPALKEKRLRLLKRNTYKVHSSGAWKKREAGASIQYLNSFGTCDLQAKHCFWQEYRALGRIPKHDEISGKLKNLVYTRFKSYNEALKTWGISDEEIETHRKNGERNAVQARAAHNFYPKYNRQLVDRQVRNFMAKENRLPTWTEALRKGFPSREVFKRLYGTNRKVELEAIFSTPLKAAGL